MMTLLTGGNAIQMLWIAKLYFCALVSEVVIEPKPTDTVINIKWNYNLIYISDFGIEQI